MFIYLFLLYTHQFQLSYSMFDIWCLIVSALLNLVWQNQFKKLLLVTRETKKIILYIHFIILNGTYFYTIFVCFHGISCISHFTWIEGTWERSNIRLCIFEGCETPPPISRYSHTSSWPPPFSRVMMIIVTEFALFFLIFVHFSSLFT